MKITVLAENQALCDKLKAEHGLSLWIETKKHKILFDVGAGELFYDNAKKLGIDIAQADTMILSHDHYDHGGGLKTFLQVNEKAKIYMQQEVFGQRYAKDTNGAMTEIGLDKSLQGNDRFVFVQDELVIDEELTIFADVDTDIMAPTGNARLFMQSKGALKADDFVHEQNLLLSYGTKKVLFTGCAHRGIVNILEHVYRQTGRYADVVIGGFHLFDLNVQHAVDEENIRQIGRYMQKTGKMYYTGHCTGQDAYEVLKEMLCAKIEPLCGGSVIIIDE